MRVFNNSDYEDHNEEHDEERFIFLQMRQRLLMWALQVSTENPKLSRAQCRAVAKAIHRNYEGAEWTGRWP